MSFQTEQTLSRSSTDDDPQLFRSKATQPRLYQCALRAISFSARGTELKREHERVTESEGPFEVALAEFERVFWEKTCIGWDERMVVKKGPESPAGQPAWFRWTNRPVGP